MTLKAAIDRLEDVLFPEFDKTETGRGILEGGWNADEKPLPRDLAVEMTALLMAIQAEKPEYFHYRILNWFPRAVFYENYGDSLYWWASAGNRGFESKYRAQHPMPDDLIAALEKARSLVEASKTIEVKTMTDNDLVDIGLTSLITKVHFKDVKALAQKISIESFDTFSSTVEKILKYAEETGKLPTSKKDIDLFCLGEMMQPNTTKGVMDMINIMESTQ
jgi:hypothetical protein